MRKYGEYKDLKFDIVKVISSLSEYEIIPNIAIKMTYDPDLCVNEMKEQIQSHNNRHFANIILIQ